MYADVSKIEVPENVQYNRIIEEYLNYKRSYVNNVQFNASANSTFFSEYFWPFKEKKKILSAEDLPSSSLELVHIFFDTASYDEIERDTKIKFEGQLSLIGGTMGLLTGFSIISGVEILYFLVQFVTGWILAKIETLVDLRNMPDHLTT